MKQFYLLITVSVVFAAFSIKIYHPTDITQLVVMIPELTTNALKEKLELDFNNLTGVSKCEVSLMTKTMMIKFDAKEVSQEEIQMIFQKWSCTPGEHSYQKLY
jgi:copper chaperone CopZ